MALFVIIMLYEESWIFDRRKGQVFHFHGILPLKKSRVISFEEIEALSVSAFRKGSVGESVGSGEKKRFFQRDLIRFSLVLRDSSRRDIEITEAKHGDTLRQRTATIAEFMNISFLSEI